MSSIFIFCHFTGKIEGKIEDGEIRGLKQMDMMGSGSFLLLYPGVYASSSATDSF